MRTRDIIKAWLIESGLDLAVDDTVSGLICPFCNGGQHDDKSFSVTRLQEGYLFHCYRASCGVSGLYSAQATGYGGKAKSKKEFTAKPYSGKTVPISEVQRSWLTNRYSLSEEEVAASGVSYCPDRDSYAWPIRDIRGYTTGIVDRTYAELGNKRKPKSISYWFNDVPKIYFPRMELFLGKTVLVVEDLISAIKGARYVNTIAVLSSNLTESDAIWLSRYYSRCVFCLDRDAFGASVYLAKKYNIVFSQGTKPLLIPKDLKDMNHSELDQFLGEYRDQ